MKLRRSAAMSALTAAAVATVAGCTSGSDGNGTPAPTATATSTVTGSPVSPSTPVATATVTATATASATSTGNASGTGLCTPTVMTFALGQSSGAGGTSYFAVIATNASQQPCVTTGYPGLALLDGSGSQILQADRDQSTSGSVTTITVQPGQRISAVVGAQDVGTGGGVCVSSPAFLFTLPDNTDSTTIAHVTPACRVSVQPFTRYTGP